MEILKYSYYNKQKWIFMFDLHLTLIQFKSENIHQEDDKSCFHSHLLPLTKLVIFPQLDFLYPPPHINTIHKIDLLDKGSVLWNFP